MELFTVYRAGPLAKASRYGHRDELFSYADSLRPQGNVGRLEGLFCTPSLAGLVHWERLARRRATREHKPVELWQLTCAAPVAPRVHSTVRWEAASAAWERLQLGGRCVENTRLGHQRRLESSCRCYWQQTFALDEYLAGPHGWPWCADQAELLVRPEWIVAAATVELPLAAAPPAAQAA